MSNLSNLKTIPSFKNEDEERDFWLKNDSSEYIDWSKAQQGHFPNLKLSAKSVAREIYWRYFLDKTAQFLLVVSVFLLALSSIYTIFTQNNLLNQNFLHFFTIIAAASLIYKSLGLKSKTQKQV